MSSGRVSSANSTGGLKHLAHIHAVTINRAGISGYQDRKATRKRFWHSLVFPSRTHTLTNQRSEHGIRTRSQAGFAGAECSLPRRVPPVRWVMSSPRTLPGSAPETDFRAACKLLTASRLKTLDRLRMPERILHLHNWVRSRQSGRTWASTLPLRCN